MKLILALATGMVVGAASATWWVQRTDTTVEPPVSTLGLIEENRATPTIRDVDVAVEWSERVEPASEGTEDWPERVRDLERKLAAKDGELLMLRQSMTAAPVLPVVNQTVEPDERLSWLENLRTQDPQQYQELMERREAARQEARYALAKKAAHFLFRDEAAMSEQEAEHHQRMMSLLHESLKLTESLQVDMSGEERRDIARSLRRNIRDLAPLLETERDKELYRIGKDIGYSDEDAAGFALYVREVIDLTSVQSIFRGAMRSMGGWGGWGDGERPRNP
ncbi:MAG TPA: hypothetical protein PKE26_04030 [Kiritimatiellia bacterium]|nr:hypothetical protein [Kiritimatiellia bacterium]HMO98258.1 hypothetical protein [Kiritimatiellia bacterium]HMP96603.1 hypothetical protein [Kiritimatiellia bacterium]